jgi:hypothetical protein
MCEMMFKGGMDIDWLNVLIFSGFSRSRTSKFRDARGVTKIRLMFQHQGNFRNLL